MINFVSDFIALTLFQVEGTNFSVCIVFTEKDKQIDINFDGDANDFLFYRFDLKPPPNTCNMMSKIASTGIKSYFAVNNK